LPPWFGGPAENAPDYNIGLEQSARQKANADYRAKHEQEKQRFQIGTEK